MNQNPQIDDNLTFCPSFNCYTTSSSSSAAAIKISNSLLPEHDNEFNFVIEEDDNHLSPTVYPLFNQKEENCDTLQNLFITEREDDQEHDTSSSDEEDEDEGNEENRGAVFCVWKGKSDTSSSSVSLSKCKKSRSTGSGSKRWRIRDLLRRSNSEGKEPAIMLVSHHNNNNKKVSVEKVKRNSSVEGNNVNNGRSKPSVHEIFYVQNRAKTQDGKRRSYLPYRQGLVGFFTNVNGKGKSFPF
ncbi:nipped-B-like protein [Tanacetum coccineum]|uniref:Nipped-B-like protein n=1 Tax=Tanacetum coccineum TaxID=301880 RepID=A0ABQ5EM21_9ASTR